MLKSIIIIFILITISSCGHAPLSTKVIERKINETVYTSGNIESSNQYQLVSLVSGYIQNIKIEEGDQVNKGQVLVVLANDGGLIALKSAELNRNFSDIKQNKNKIKELKSSINTAKLKWKNDSIQLNRKKILVENKVISENDFENFEVMTLSSKSNYTSQLLQLEDLQKQLKLNDELGKKNYDQSNKQVKDFNIKSEIDGVVFTILKKEGEMVNSQAPIAIIGSNNDYILKLQVDEYDITKIKLGQLIKVKLDSYKGQVFEAKVSKISLYMNEKTKTFTIEGRFINQPKTLYPNLTLEANIIIKSNPKALLISREYLFNDKYVFLKNGSKKRVGTGIMDLKYVEIKNGLQRGDEIIIPNEN